MYCDVQVNEEVMAAFDFASLELDDAGDSREERVSEVQRSEVK
jgi:hypothetical protein